MYLGFLTDIWVSSVDFRFCSLVGVDFGDFGCLFSFRFSDVFLGFLIAFSVFCFDVGFLFEPIVRFFWILGIFALRLIFSRKLIRSSTFEFHFVRAFYFGLLCHSEVCGVVLANFGMGLDSFSSLFLSFPFDIWFSRFILGFLGCFSVFLLF